MGLGETYPIAEKISEIAEATVIPARHPCIAILRMCVLAFAAKYAAWQNANIALYRSWVFVVLPVFAEQEARKAVEPIDQQMRR